MSSYTRLNKAVLRRPLEPKLTAAVRVEDHSGRRVAGGDRVGQRVGDQLGAQVIGEGEPDDPAGGDVQDGREVEPAFPGGDVGDVAAPPLG
jgi:hypothetical protein